MIVAKEIIILLILTSITSYANVVQTIQVKIISYDSNRSSTIEDKQGNRYYISTKLLSKVENVSSRVDYFQLSVISSDLILVKKNKKSTSDNVTQIPNEELLPSDIFYDLYKTKINAEK